MPYHCPICTNALLLNPSCKSYHCTNNHHFDLAKQGYLNLLPVQHKNSKQPGDSKEMLQARRNFLEAGYFQNLATSLANTIEAHTTELQSINLLDLGCGEGYYSRQITSFFSAKKRLQLYGLDIAKTAVAMAAQKQPIGQFAVASFQRLPYADNYFDLLIRVFAPSNSDELCRVLKPSGLLLTVTPGPRHLWQLKEFIYQEAREHESETNVTIGFQTLTSQRLHSVITPPVEQRMALLQMTPFAWRANVEAVNAIKESNQLSIETDFIISLSKKISNEDGR
jgi:23S rRNA (guanine745-N1)-methyltransferase